MMISLLKYSKQNCYLQVKNRKKELLKPIYNSFRLKKDYFQTQESYFQAHFF